MTNTPGDLHHQWEDWRTHQLHRHRGQSIIRLADVPFRGCRERNESRAEARVIEIAGQCGAGTAWFRVSPPRPHPQVVPHPEPPPPVHWIWLLRTQGEPDAGEVARNYGGTGHAFQGRFQLTDAQHWELLGTSMSARRELVLATIDDAVALLKSRDDKLFLHDAVAHGAPSVAEMVDRFAAALLELFPDDATYSRVATAKRLRDVAGELERCT